MSLAKTLLKVAIGVAVVKGVSSLAGGKAESAPAPKPAPKARKPGTVTAKKTARTPDPAPSVPGRGTRYDPRSPKAAGDLLDQVLGSTGPGRGKASAPRGDMADLLDDLSAGKRAAPRKKAPAPGTLRPILLPEPDRGEELSEALLLRAVLQAVKCDGTLDEAEKRRLIEAMGEADAREVAAVNAELARPVDVEGLARLVPAGLEPQVYTVSLMAIDLDQQAEAEYLHALAGALELSPQEVNALHDRAGAPRLYR